MRKVHQTSKTGSTANIELDIANDSQRRVMKQSASGSSRLKRIDSEEEVPQGVNEHKMANESIQNHPRRERFQQPQVQHSPADRNKHQKETEDRSRSRSKGVNELKSSPLTDQMKLFASNLILHP